MRKLYSEYSLKRHLVSIYIAALISIVGGGAHAEVAVRGATSKSASTKAVTTKSSYGSWGDPCEKGFGGGHDCKPAVAPVTPSLACVRSNSNGTFTAFLGYENLNSAAITVPRGSSAAGTNTFYPAPADRGQPDKFEPGNKSAVFSVVFDGKSTTWTVTPAGGKERSIEFSKKSKSCGPITPLVECVDPNLDGTYTARFGYQNDNGFEFPLPLGEENAFSETPADRGQPVFFFPGRAVNVFSTKFKGESLTWKLGSLSATAVKSGERCTPNKKPACNAGPATYSMACQGAQTKITLDGTKSLDPEGFPVAFSWTTDCSNATISDPKSSKPVLTLTGPGAGKPASCKVSLVISDGYEESSCAQRVEVPACSSDCKGTPGGSAKLDQCGVCNGNNACFDCKGIPNGGAVVDKCGVCGGSDKCVDCRGEPNGTSKLDRCGVCDGNGKTCLGCIESDISPLLFALDNNSLEQKGIALRAIERLEKEGRGNREILNFAADARRQASALQVKNWQLTWTNPRLALNCTNTVACATVDNQQMLDQYNVNSAALRDLTRSVVRKTEQLDPAGRQRGIAIIRNSDKSHRKSLELTAALPRFVSQCG